MNELLPEKKRLDYLQKQSSNNKKCFTDCYDKVIKHS